MSIQKSAQELRIEQLLADNQALRQQGEDLRIDAARYRWLRAQHWNSSAICVVTEPTRYVRLGAFCPSERQLDNAIDSALAIERVKF